MRDAVASGDHGREPEVLFRPSGWLRVCIPQGVDRFAVAQEAVISWLICCIRAGLHVLFSPAETQLICHYLRRILEADIGGIRGGFASRQEKRAGWVRLGRGTSRAFTALVLFLAAGLTGCSVKKFAINKIGDSLANSGTTFSSDNDPELVGEAVPFSLKLIESLLAESPKHRGLLLAATMDFTQYAYAFVQEPADETEGSDVEKANALRTRARLLYVRARDYGLRGLETRHRGFSEALRREPKTAVRSATAKDIPLLYWTAVSWGAAIAQSKDHPDLVAEQPIVEALVDRAYALDPNFDHGAIEQFLISYESARQGATGDFAGRSRAHFDKAVTLTKGQLASPFVAYAETVSIQKQDRGEFEAMLKKALAIDPDARIEWRLNNLVIQRRARWLLSREDDLFLEKSATGGSR